VTWDAVVVGAGPNGLAAAVELAGAGRSVLVLEAADTPGGSARSEALTLPGFIHDAGSAVYPLGAGSPFLSRLPLEEHGLRWLHPEVALAHPLDRGRAVGMYRDLDRTARELGEDGPAYRRLVEPFVRRWDTFAAHVLHTPVRLPRAPLLMARFGFRALRAADGLARSLFRSPEARALLAGNAAHSGLPLDRMPSSAPGLVLMVAAHAVGWPVAAGGGGSVSAALVSLLRARGGVLETGRRVRSLDELPPRRATLLDLTPRQVGSVAGAHLPPRLRRRLGSWRYGPGAFKVDWALDGPVPWTAGICRRAGTVHVGGGLEEMVEAERAPWEGRVASRPFVLVAQPSLVDPERAPPGRHTAWAYCHVPNGWDGDATEAVEDQIERFAPGFRDRILGRSVRGPGELQSWNANLVGGDVNGGAFTLGQTAARPSLSRTPWRLTRGLYLCSASTAPGGGVHGMCGYHAARTALEDLG
jgi:phytoene dehydrogenase-like protein